MTEHIVIVAGGKGLRMGGELPKQFLPLCNKPVLMHTIEAFYSYNPLIHIVLVLPSDFVAHWQTLCKEYNFSIAHSIALGGETRFHSVKNGLELVADGYVGIHDAARPFASCQMISHCFEQARKHRAVVPAIPLTDSCRMVNGNNNQVIDRASVRLIQTPQVFETQLLKEAYKQNFSDIFTDDASVVESLCPITLVPGETTNIKLTNPIDMALGKYILENKNQIS